MKDLQSDMKKKDARGKMLESFMRRKTSERIKEGGKMQRRQRWEVKEEQPEEKETQR